MDYEFFLLGASGFVGGAILKRLVSLKRSLLILEHRREVRYPHKVRAPLWRVPCPAVRSAGTVIHAARLAGSTPIKRFLVSLIGMWANDRLMRCGPEGTIFLSGSLVYGEGEATESSPLRPISFQRHYSLQERPVLRAMEEGRRVSIVRPGWVVGCGSWLRRFYLDVMVRRGFVPLYGYDGAYMSLVNAEDVADFVISIADREVFGRTFNLASTVMTRGEFVSMLSDISGMPIRRVDVSGYDTDTAMALTHSLILRSEQREVQEFQFSPIRPVIEECFNLLVG